MNVSFKKKVTGHICTIQWDRILVHQCICWECNTFEDDFLKQCRFHYVFYAPNSCLPVINKLLIFILTIGKRNSLKLFQILFVLKPKKFQGPIYKYLFHVFRSFSMDPPISWKIIIKTLDFIQRTQLSQSGLDLIK